MSAIAECAANGIEQQLQAIWRDMSPSDAVEAAQAIAVRCREVIWQLGVSAEDVAQLVYLEADEWADRVKDANAAVTAFQAIVERRS